MKPLISLVVTTLVAPAFGQEPPRYRAVLLPVRHAARSINAQGDVLVTPPGRAYVQNHDGSTTNIPSSFWAYGITDHRFLTGYKVISSLDKPYIFDTANNTATPLSFAGDIAIGYSMDMNASGTIVGVVSASQFGAAGRAVKWTSPTEWSYLQTPTGAVAFSADHINAAGYIAGPASLTGDDLLWAPGAVRGVPIRANGRSVTIWEMSNTYGFIAIEDSVQGQATRTHIFNYEGTIAHTIANPLGGNRYIGMSTLTESGWAAGGMEGLTPEGASYRAALWSAHTGVVDVMSLVDGPPTDFHLTSAYLSDSMVMYGKDNRNPESPKYYILEPVPEPGTLITLCASWAVRLRRRHTRSVD